MSRASRISSRVPCVRLLDDRQRRAQAAREDVGLDPVRPATLGLVGGVGERDHLEAQPAARPQRPVARPRSTSCSTRRRRPRASRSTRSRRTGRRCRGSRGAGCPPGAPARPPGRAPGRGRAAPREIVIDVTRQPSSPGRVQREPAPARPDLQDVHPGGQARALGDPAVLVPLGVGERLLRRLEHGARVGHRLVQEQPVEVVAQVVVGRDVLAGLVLRVAPGPVREQARDLERQPPPASSCTRAPSG